MDRGDSSDLHPHPDDPLHDIHSDSGENMPGATGDHAGTSQPSLKTRDQDPAMSPLLPSASQEGHQSPCLLARNAKQDVVLSSRSSVQLQAEQPTESSDRTLGVQGEIGSVLSQAPTQESRCSVTLFSLSLSEDSDDHEEPLQQDRRSQTSQQSHMSDASGNVGNIIPGASAETATWLPYTLRTPFLCLLTASTATLLFIIVLLCWLSLKHDGLGIDDGSSVILFGWRFTPSLVAVLYVQLTAMLLDDVKRTECFAQLARPGGAPAASSLLRAPGAWWNALANGVSNCNGGPRSWLLFSSACINILGFLAISPLSSSLLQSTDVTVTEEISFHRVAPRLPLNLTSGRDTKLRIFGHLYQNISTSAWNTNDHTIIPFWPSRLETPSRDHLLSASTQTWRADSIVLSTDLDCEPVSLRGFSETPTRYWQGTLYNISSPYGANTMTLDSKSGCTTVVVGDIGGYSWFIPSSFQSIYWMALNQSEECGDKETLWIQPELLELSMTEPEENRFIGYSCTANFYMAQLEVIAHISPTSSDVVFDEGEYRKKKLPILKTFLDHESFQNLTFHERWQDYLGLSSPYNSGLNILLGALYGYDTEAMLRDQHVPSRAAKIKQTIFAETIQHSIWERDMPAESVPGKVTSIQRRVVIMPSIAVTLAVIFGISLCLQLVVWYRSNLHIRPLNLSEDPATAAGIATLILYNSRTHQEIRSLNADLTSNLKQKLLGKQYYTTQNAIHESSITAIDLAETRPHQKTQKPTWIPLILQLRSLSALTLCLCALTAAVVALNNISQQSQLYRTAFVYQAHISILGSHMIQPFSVIPTLLAVIISLWWGAIDTTFRRLQPYIAMTQALPRRFSCGVALSYQSSYWAWAAYKAASKRHWFLLLVTIGTSLAPALTIAMSALFERERSGHIYSIPVSRTLELRQIPLLYEQEMYRGSQRTDASWPVINAISDVYLWSPQNWLTGATLQLSMNSPQPPWSRDGWSFIPIPLSHINNESLVQNVGNSSFRPKTNISIATPAIRGRIECTQYADPQNTSAWLVKWDLGNTSYWNDTTIPHGVRTAYEAGVRDSLGRISYDFFDTKLLPDGTGPTCCTDDTNGPVGNSVIGNWSPLWTNSITKPPFTFITKWVYGNLTKSIKNVNVSSDSIRLLFLDVPSIQALQCTPIIEKASANVVVEPISGQVMDFSITKEPVNAIEAWTDNFRDDYRNHNEWPKNIDYNVTISYGELFLMTMWRAFSHMEDWDMSNSEVDYSADTEQNFNFRDPEHGLNFDFMTYAMYSLVGEDPLALLDAKTMMLAAQKTFTTFFQHFVSSNVSFETGSFAYQPINYTLPPCLWHYNGSACKNGIKWPVSHTNGTATAEISTEIELLKTNAVAVWLSVAILVWLVATTVVIAAVQRKYLKNLKGDVDCAADILALIAGSDRLLEVLQERREGRIEDDDAIKTKLGWFKDSNGQRRWGIEVVDREDDGDA